MSIENENGNFATPMLPAVFVGQTLFREVNTRYEKSITEHTVTKVGRKYLECTDLRDKITIANLKYENNIYLQNNYQMYLSKQEILDKNEMNSLFSKIKQSFSDYNHHDKFTIEQLRQIADVVGCR
jgi:hypothetical protein